MRSEFEKFRDIPEEAKTMSFPTSMDKMFEYSLKAFISGKGELRSSSEEVQH